VAIRQAVTRTDPDFIILSTLPAGTSRWLKMDLPHRVERKFGRPVEHIEAGGPTDAPAPRPAEADDAGPDIGVMVLLVEDDPQDVELTKLALERSSVPHTIRVARNGASALEYMRANGVSSVDVVILDLKMPVLDGFGFLEQAQSDVDLGSVDVVVLTTSSHESDRARAHDLGVAAYMLKVPDFDEFCHAMSGLLEEAAG